MTAAIISRGSKWTAVISLFEADARMHLAMRRFTALIVLLKAPRGHQLAIM